MDALTLHRKIYSGRAKAALRIGLPTQVYRPSGPQMPFNQLLTTINVAFNSGDSSYRKSNQYNDPLWFADYDGTQTLPGDYLVRVQDGQIWFVAAQQQLLPILTVGCNRQIVVDRQPASAAVGAVPYGGLTNLSPILGATAAWPCAILIGGRTQASMGLPADVKEAGWRILLPPSFSTILESGDIIVDDMSRRFAIEAAEKTDLGWRLTANEVHS